MGNYHISNLCKRKNITKILTRFNIGKYKCRFTER